MTRRSSFLCIGLASLSIFAFTFATSHEEHEDKIQILLRSIAQRYVNAEADPKFVVPDNHLDAIFGHLPGWVSDRHPNIDGYNVIAAETAKFFAPVIRERRAKQ